MLLMSGAVYSDDSVNTPYSSNPLESSVSTSKQLFKSGWYGHSKDVTYIKLIQVGKDMGLSILFSSTGYFVRLTNIYHLMQIVSFLIPIIIMSVMDV